METDLAQVGTRCREGDDHQSDSCIGGVDVPIDVPIEVDVDGGGRRGKERGTERNELSPDGRGRPRHEGPQVRKQRFAHGGGLQNGGNSRGREAQMTSHSELPHPSSVLPETSPFERRWRSLERLSIQMVKGKRNYLSFAHLQ